MLGSAQLISLGGRSHLLLVELLCRWRPAGGGVHREVMSSREAEPRRVAMDGGVPCSSAAIWEEIDLAERFGVSIARLLFLRRLSPFCHLVCLYAEEEISYPSSTGFQKSVSKELREEKGRLLWIYDQGIYILFLILICLQLPSLLYVWGSVVSVSFYHPENMQQWFDGVNWRRWTSWHHGICRHGICSVAEGIGKVSSTLIFCTTSFAKILLKKYYSFFLLCFFYSKILIINNVGASWDR